MADMSFTAAEIKPLVFNGAVLRRYLAGGTITVGHLVYVASDGDVERADGNVSAAVAEAIGVAVESYDGETTINSGDPVSVCVFGPISGFASMTAGTILWVSDTIGRIADAAGTFDRVVGYAETAGIVFVNPDINVPSSA